MRDDTKPARPRGRPRQFDPAAILPIISNAFRDGGFSSTSLDDLSGATGLNRPSLYAAFGDKKAMYLATLDRLIPYIEEQGRLIDPGRPLISKLRAMAKTSIDGYLAGENGPRGCLAVGTAAAEAVSDPDIRARLDAFLKVADALVASWFVQAGFTDGEIRGAMFTSAVHALGIRARAGQPRETLEAIAAKLCELSVLPSDARQS